MVAYVNEMALYGGVLPLHHEIWNGCVAIVNAYLGMWYMSLLVSTLRR